MNADQIRQLVTAVRTHGWRAVPPLSSTTERDWYAWRRNFEVLADIGEWDERQQRLLIAAAMTGNARSYVAGIETLSKDPAAPASELLDAYEDRFVLLAGKWLRM